MAAHVIDRIAQAFQGENQAEGMAVLSGLVAHDAPRLPGDFNGYVEVVARNAAGCRQAIGQAWIGEKLDWDQAVQAYTALADITVQCMLARCAWATAAANGRFLDGRFVVLGMGKMGSREMSAQSDLDMVFVYDVPGDDAESDGIDGLPAGTYYARMVRQLIAALTSHTGSGPLYEVDARLRPFGDSGPIATSLAAFRRYYGHDAWTWEFQALTRARVVAGDADLAEKMKGAITAILTAPRDREKLLNDVADMRRRMVRQRPNPKPWEVKYRRGGLIDLEFLAQYGQLLHAPEQPGVLSPVTGQALANLGSLGLWPEPVVEDLCRGLDFWQRTQLAFRALVAGGSELEEEAAYDRALAMVTGLATPEARSLAADQMAERIHAHYQSLIEDRATPPPLL